jgi:hypothetical protein
METISGGPSEEFLPDTILQAAKLNKALENWVVTEVPGEDEGEIGDVVFVTGPGDGGSSSSVGGGKVLQIVRAMDRSQHRSSSSSWVSVPVQIEITPTKADSWMLVEFIGVVQSTQGSATANIRVVDADGNALDGAQRAIIRAGNDEMIQTPVAIKGCRIPGSTTTCVYGIEVYTSNGGEVVIHGDLNPTQMFVYEMEDVVVSP